MTNAKFKSFEEVPVWQVAHNVVLKIYQLTKRFPKEELYGLTSQLRRAAFSVSANIAEGFYRNTTKELIQFLYNSRGSCGEVLNYLYLARDLKFIETSDFNQLSIEYNSIAKQLNNWINSLKKKIDKH